MNTRIIVNAGYENFAWNSMNWTHKLNFPMNFIEKSCEKMNKKQKKPI